jgi:alpha 1,6-mannosyltransferase
MINMSFARRRSFEVAAFVITGIFLLSYFVPAFQTLGLSRHRIRRGTLVQRLGYAFPYDARQRLPNTIWQTWKHSPEQAEFEEGYREAWHSWNTLNPSHQHEVITDAAASQLVADLYMAVPEVSQAYEALPKPVLKADFFRYLILLARGGVYSDIDTRNLKPIEDWIPADLKPYGLIVGIEADPDRVDWNDWYARRVQLCQWTIASNPGHPVLANIVSSITEETLRRQRDGELDKEHMKTVMEFTGPGIWTDKVFDYLNTLHTRDRAIPSDITWHHLANLTERKKIGDVVVLPITSFSPGVGHMGAGHTGDPMAFVHHEFSGKINPPDVWHMCTVAHNDFRLVET